MLNFTCINSFNLTTTAKPSGVSTHVTLRLLRLLGNEVPCPVPELAKSGLAPEPVFKYSAELHEGFS